MGVMSPTFEANASRVRDTEAALLIGKASVAIYRFLTRGRDKAFSVLSSGAFAEYGQRSVIQLPVRLLGEARIAVGSDVFVGARSWLQVLGERRGSVAIVIGDGTSIAGSCVLSAAKSIRLGREVLMARNVYIADHMHAFDDTRRAVLAQGLDRVAPVEVGDGAWLGQNVVVGPGVRVGRGAVIGANSVVLDDVPDYTVAVGAPARAVRSLPGEGETPST
jgi:acetyltransferase-like isoleucine patch superfamily enzyme